MLQERNVINGMLVVVLSSFSDFLFPLRWFLILAGVIIIVDLRFGVKAAQTRGEQIRFSRAGRRTINKMVDYLCWVMLAGSLGKAIGEPFGLPLLPALVLLIVFGFEINSCFNNYFESRGKKMKINIFEYFKRKTDIIDVKEEDDEPTTK